ncbi:hypothetical protein DPMN_038086 [Dreissena polymorpha]|uniref:Uncharacterized protein n=1 Tax=Dreissena polymorpha TaxID=45954 RepID=A0A9D4MDN8_DREPO|nr:hypothetical protein DPMN_038086 [Dreissena polymorpha]
MVSRAYSGYRACRNLIAGLIGSGSMGTLCLGLGQMTPCRPRPAEQAYVAGGPCLSVGFRRPTLGRESIDGCVFIVSAWLTVPVTGSQLFKDGTNGDQNITYLGRLCSARQARALLVGVTSLSNHFGKASSFAAEAVRSVASRIHTRKAERNRRPAFGSENGAISCRF